LDSYFLPREGVTPLLPAVNELYQWRREAGTGGQSKVYIADSRITRRPVAIKTVALRATDEETQNRRRELILREAGAMEALSQTPGHRLYAGYIGFHEGPTQCGLCAFATSQHMTNASC
jgi:serine/threonine protein kinase